ncbi:TSUP family transporter [Paracoccus sp. 1_MG-2023]|uniref:TSUP family transporter n=1 Tax=unclassified Paracoccus (in: a-proteobacteria) TaxID=2688777 RepID=UPI001C098CF8|nr:MULTISPECIES: TSUP family transporter [unclassified Paracoccus (in: a-proteobacteria)]MBU2957334.1 TSUP family transporter [Paracoccus sp. C2R09]MDO6669898.1 TSUP family transporter [Paracoccus sp. 1_MG-2023]
MLDLTLDLFLLLVAAGFAAGFIDSIAGGGGLITVPALMLAGIPPAQALATNKVQGLFGAGTAAISYARRGLVDLRSQWRQAAIAGVAGAVGAALISSVPTDGLRLLLPVILIGIALFFALKPGLNDLDRIRRMGAGMFAATIVPLVGFYDGLIGPGAGAFYMIGFVTLAGYGVLKATAHTKLLNFASNLGGLAAFALVGKPLWTLGLAMGAAQIAGAMLGARLASRIGARLIKPLLVATSSILAVRLIWQML